MTPLPLPPPPSSTRARTSRAGFTLIEVMVATSILLVIVLMIGSIFRQASSFWDTGYARAEGGMVVRSVVGALGRDLATAIDGRRFEPNWDGPVRGIQPGGSSSSFSFYCYKPPTGKGDSYQREIHRITYTASGGSVTRKDEILPDSPGSGSLTDNGVSTIADVDNAKFEFFASSGTAAGREYEKPSSAPDFAGGVAWTVPAIKVRLSLETDNTFSGLEVRSFGRDGVPNEESQKKADDIVVK